MILNVDNMVFGYKRVSKKDQNLHLQDDALSNYKCDKVYFEKESGVKYRKEWDALHSQLRKGDTVVVWKIDRLGRTAWELIKLMTEFKEKDIRFISISEGIDTDTPMGKIWFSLNAILAENERTVQIERTIAGLKAAKERGRVGGRPKGLTPDAELKMKAVKNLYASNVSIAQIRQTLNIKSNSTVYKYINY
ncbi:Site-specific DNA recombinase [Pedobacter terrae]|uniref:Site-specific DNA recombinase n=1 Tax=Pedobacter terrae TaxID=405671 RepID=A0A1G8D986_9SPHI|nr:recombinase family protein [Pedobacter terrae]SDH53840.1 Site-specific DNA recombinase [Pedobacter terrae]